MAKTKRTTGTEIAVAPRKKKVPGSRKLGNKKRKPSAKRYLHERRWITNKERRRKRRERHSNRPRSRGL